MDSPRSSTRFIYLAGPCTPLGGGMLKVSEYLVQHAASHGGCGFRLLETRGGGRAFASALYVLRAMCAIAAGRVTGRLAGVHVNSAERLSLLRKAIILAWCRLLDVPTVLHSHAAELPASYASLPPLARALVRIAFGLPSACIALGQNAADFMAGELHVSPGKVRIVPNGVPEPALARAERSGDTFRLLFVGNLSERKGVTDLLQALASPALGRLRVELTLAGGGPVEHYREQALRLGVGERTRFTGWASKEALERELAQADALVLPSYNEGLPLAILEALAQRVPVICTPVGEIPNYLTHGENALIVPRGAPEAIAAAVATLVEYPALGATLAQAGRRLYEERFSLASFATGIGAIHHQCFGWNALAPDAAPPAPALVPVGVELLQAPSRASAR
jgi:glycosyltransferase involved in cell wall biosynthesis